MVAQAINRLHDCEQVAPPVSASYSAAHPVQNRINMVAACALVAVPAGTSVESVTPVIIFAPQAHCMAGIAYAEISIASE